MHIPALTEERLRTQLDANQVARERLCQGVLALDGRYSDVRPRHPKGGPDKGRDLQARYSGDQLAFGAVGFLNGANDSAAQKRAIKIKFREDLDVALGATPPPTVFAFFTNVALTASEKDGLVAQAFAKGITHCDVFDREHIRVVLDSTDGYALRLQYLNIPLSEAEQTSFFARWGDGIQAVISNRFERIDDALDRILFLQEGRAVLDGVTVRFVLDRPYTADEIGHFRAFCSIYLRGVKLNIFGVLIGSSDRASRFYHQDEDQYLSDTPGIKGGFSSASWENIWPSPEEQAGVVADEDPDDAEETEPLEKWSPHGSSTTRGYDPVQMIVLHYRHDDALIRFRERLRLEDLNQAKMIFEADARLAVKVEAIEVFANGYSLAVYDRGDFRVTEAHGERPMDHRFTSEELMTPWKKLEAVPGWTFFELDFASRTPRRTFEAQKVAATARMITVDGRALELDRKR